MRTMEAAEKEVQELRRTLEAQKKKRDVLDDELLAQRQKIESAMHGNEGKKMELRKLEQELQMENVVLEEQKAVCVCVYVCLYVCADMHAFISRSCMSSCMQQQMYFTRHQEGTFETHSMRGYIFVTTNMLLMRAACVWFLLLLYAETTRRDCEAQAAGGRVQAGDGEAQVGACRHRV